MTDEVNAEGGGGSCACVPTLLGDKDEVHV